jgi:hypothetical protein
MTSYPTPPPSTRLHPTWAFARVGEYVRTVHALAPNILTAPSSKTIATLCHFHPLVEVDLPLFINDFHPETDFVLDRKAFISTLIHSPYLSSNGPF